MQTPDSILEFWLDDVGPQGWYKSDPELDAQVRDRFLTTWNAARGGACGLWLTSPSGLLAYIVMMDQFPRNMFRDAPEAFVTDPNARAACRIATERDWDMRITEPARQFFYMPLMHSENIVDLDSCIRLLKVRMPDTGASTLDHARAHRAIVHEFGRYPFRNAALGRDSTKAEAAFLKNGGYGAALRKILVEKTAEIPLEIGES